MKKYSFCKNIVNMYVPDAGSWVCCQNQQVVLGHWELVASNEFQILQQEWEPSYWQDLTEEEENY